MKGQISVTAMAFAQGEEAARSGGDYSQNPYPKKSQLKYAWTRGYNSALREGGGMIDPEAEFRGIADMTNEHIGAANALATEFRRHASGKRTNVILLALAYMVVWVHREHPDKYDFQQTLHTLVQLIDDLVPPPPADT